MKSGHSADHGEQVRDGSDTENDSRNQFCSSYPLPVLLVSRAAYRYRNVEVDIFALLS